MFSTPRYLSFIHIFALTLIISTGCKKSDLSFKQVEQLTSNTSNRLNRIHFIDNNTGFIIGGQRFLEANILITTDGGNTWTVGSYPEAGKGLYGINQTPTGNIVAIGFDGKILHTNDTGKQWDFHQLQKYYSYKDIAFNSNNEGIIIGGVSFNSGVIIKVNKDWQTIAYDSMSVELNDLVMINDMTSYIAGYGAVLKTTDGGSNWAYLDIKNDNFTSLFALNPSEFWTCGYAGSVYHTTDGGTTWQKLRNGNSLTIKKYNLLKIYFKDSNTGWACGEKGLFIATTDGGKTWTEHEQFTEDALRDITMLPDGNLLVVGDNGGIYKLHL